MVASLTESRRQRQANPEVQKLIAQGRSAPVRLPARVGWVLSGLTAVLLWASFTPLDWGPLGWVALVPLILLVRLAHRPRWLYPAVYATGLVSTLALLQWMRLGHVTMYPAWIALSLYVALYFPVFVALSRLAVHRLAVPLTLTIPTLWVGLEYLRAHLMTGFSWYYLGHTQYRWVELIQISDLVGAYGVSFVVALTAACLTGLIPLSLLGKLRLVSDSQRHLLDGHSPSRKRQAAGVAVCLTLFAVTLAYGYFRRAQADFQEGPRVALIQGNFPTSVKHDPDEAQRIFNRHHDLTGRAVKHQPEVVIWPETMYRAPLLKASSQLSDQELRQLAPHVPPEAWQRSDVRRTLQNMSQQAGAAMLIGIDAFVANRKDVRHYNSAVFVQPRYGITGRYDKLHRVPFGEYIPLKETFPWLHRMTPFPEDFGIAAGKQAAVFRYRGWRFSPVICFEDTVPHLVREIVASTKRSSGQGKSIDCLVNLTNDGWFHGSSELDQHLITALFRSVECRTPMVRAVNTGISAIIDGDGVVVEPDVFIDGDDKGRHAMRNPQTGEWHKQLNAALIDSVPLDDRNSFYVRWGDWFATTCLVVCLFVAVTGFVPRRFLPARH